MLVRTPYVGRRGKEHLCHVDPPRARDAFSPRSLLVRQTVVVELSPEEIYVLVEALEAEAERATQYPDRIGYVDFLYRRVAELREAGR